MSTATKKLITGMILSCYKKLSDDVSQEVPISLSEFISKGFPNDW